jgi:hypothetical protein
MPPDLRSRGHKNLRNDIFSTMLWQFLYVCIVNEKTQTLHYVIFSKNQVIYIILGLLPVEHAVLLNRESDIDRGGAEVNIRFSFQ